MTPHPHLAECRTAYDLNDPPCKHNTSLWTALSPHPANCAHCVAPTAPQSSDGREGNESRVSGEDRGSCPAGWAGVDCSACQTRDACPDIVAADGSRRKAVACTNACLVPTDEETSHPSPFGADWEDGKVFSCRCGGDARTDPYCQFQKDTTFLFHVADGDVSRGDEKDKGAALVKMHVKEYAGIPNLGEDALPWQYEYAFAPVWDANFTQCAWRVSSCPEPLPASEDCAIYECAAGKVACPPARIAATCSNAAAAGTEYSDALSSLTYHAAAKTSATATNAMTTLVMRSPVQNSGGVNAAGQWFFIDASPLPAPAYTQFPTSHVTANDGMTPCWVQ